MNDSADGGKMEFKDKCRRSVEELLRRRRISKSDLDMVFGKEIPKEEWSRLKNAIMGILPAVGVPLSVNEDDSFSVNGEWPTTFQSEFFRPYDDFEHKDRIGWLVACYLRYVSDRNVFLGSGSTVYHVSRNMIGLVNTFAELQQYRQLFWTINLAVAAELSVRGKNVLSRIAIPEGQLRTMTFRFLSVREPEWYCPIVVVSADGCLLNKEFGASLYANESSVANNTNQFIEHAVDSVICCLSSKKLRVVDNLGQNAGPPIHNPKGPNRNLKKDGVEFFLVTDEIPEEADRSDKETSVVNRKVKALEEAGWTVVTDLSEWYNAMEDERRMELGKPFWLKDADFFERAAKKNLPVRDTDIAVSK